MKKIRKIYNGLVIVGFMLFGLTLSCDNDHFLDIKPYQETIPENTDDLAMLLNDTEIQVGSNEFAIQSDDFFMESNRDFTIGKLYTWQNYFFDPLHNSVNSWTVQYKTISFANYVLEHIDHYPPPSPLKSKKFKANNTKGRALFLRANSYFLLINGYAKTYNEATAAKDLGVPMPLRMDIAQQLPRSTVQQLYDLIIKDLNQAIPLLDTTSKHPGYWPCKTSAYALLGRVYLYQKNYAKSAENSKQALNLCDFLKDYNRFAFKHPELEHPAVYGIKRYHLGKVETDKEHLFNCFSDQFSFEAHVIYSKSLINVFDKGKDLRYRYFIGNKGYSSTEEFLEPVNDLLSEGIFCSGITTPEVYLNYAEALIRQSPPQTQEALTWLNKLRENRYDTVTYQPYTASNPSEALKEVMLERRRELRLTPWRWFDMKRLGVECTRTIEGKTYTLKATSNNYIWAIPRYIMSTNPFLKQNPRGL